MPEATMKKMHLPLSEETHARLKRESEASGTPATALARQAVREWLERREQERIADELRAFALEHAGSDLDLDDEFADAASEAFAERAG
jgi:predicted transcriptional regulator